MDVASIFRGQLAQTHEFVEQAVADLTADQLHYRPAGATIQSIAAIYAHALTSEDYLINSHLRGQPTLHERNGWEPKLGFSLPKNGAEWSEAMRGCDFGALRDYAQQVYAATDDYLGSLSKADLERTIVFSPIGEMPVAAFLGNVVVWHAAGHGGEICALKGAQGGRGLPF